MWLVSCIVDKLIDTQNAFGYKVNFLLKSEAKVKDILSSLVGEDGNTALKTIHQQANLVVRK